MGVTRTDLFSELDNELALAAKALAHPARVAILHFLLKKNTCFNGDLVQELGLAQATISQHLRELKDAGILKGTIEGARLSYCINPVRWNEIKDQFMALFSQYAESIDQDCC